MVKRYIELIMRHGKESLWAWHFRDTFKIWTTVWRSWLGRSPKKEISFCVRMGSWRKDIRNAPHPADYVIIYHRLPWSRMACEASRAGGRIVIYGVLGDSREAELTTEKGYLYVTSDIFNWVELVVLAVAVSSEDELKDLFLSQVAQRTPAVLKNRASFRGCFIWDLAQIAQFAGILVPFLDSIPQDVPWLALLPECGPVRWGALAKSLTGYLVERSYIPKAKRFKESLALFRHLLANEALPEAAVLLRYPSKAVRAATLRTLATIPHQFDHRLLRLVVRDRNIKVKKALVDCIGATKSCELYPYVIKQLDSADEFLCGDAARVCAERKIWVAKPKILAALKGKVSYDLLWAVRELKLKEAIPMLKKIAADPRVFSFERNQAREVAKELRRL